MGKEPYKTLDGSLVTELVRPQSEGSEKLSLAEAVIRPGQSTLFHVHRNSEEIYYVLEGEGLLRIGACQFEARVGDARLIRPGEEHNVSCIGATPLRILCACSPPYRHDDCQIVLR